ncbi:pro-sigmaK processing inhibitor BofA family protein, partial [Pseudoflavonifractor phocaeensis]|nr:pro-sigmaK processing inhibitor BofA family protein [Pseudoflavonifractor phocaeensis]
LGVLYVLSGVGGLVGLRLGVNLVNALVLGLLGVPGFGLLAALSWALAA